MGRMVRYLWTAPTVPITGLKSMLPAMPRVNLAMLTAVCTVGLPLAAYAQDATDRSAQSPRRLLADGRNDRGRGIKLGPEVAGYMFGSDTMGGGGGVRADFLSGRWVFGAALGVRGGLGTERPEGRVRLLWVDLEGSARYTLFRISDSEIRFGVAVSPRLVFPHGLPSTDAYQSESGVDGGIAAGALGEADIAILDGQSLLARVTFGVPPLGFLATLENERPIGGLAEWELSVSVAWLWRL